MATVVFGPVHWFFTWVLLSALRRFIVEVVVGKGAVGKVVHSMRSIL